MPSDFLPYSVWEGQIDINRIPGHILVKKVDCSTSMHGKIQRAIYQWHDAYKQSHLFRIFDIKLPIHPLFRRMDLPNPENLPPNRKFTINDKVIVDARKLDRFFKIITGNTPIKFYDKKRQSCVTTL